MKYWSLEIESAKIKKTGSRSMVKASMMKSMWKLKTTNPKRAGKGWKCAEKFDAKGTRGTYIRNWQIHPKRFMEFIAIQANQFSTGNPLGRAGYGGKRSVFVFLFKLHNGKGHSQDFENELSTLWKGFLRKNTKRKIRRQQP
jgi:hypothetical protein